MDKLQEARKKINEIDKEMSELFCTRMEAVKKVSEYKQEHGLSILDAGREEQVIKRNTEYISNEELKPYYINFLKETMKISKRYQRKLLKGMRIAYSGVEGAFASIAAERIFPDGNRIPYGNFKEAYEAVVSGECDCAVLPIENNYVGEVGQVIDLVFAGNLHINGVFDLEINQSLLALPNTNIDDIKEVISHPQALGQCAEYIKKHGFEQIQCSNTAIAAQRVSESGRYDIAAIGSQESAKLYNLEVIDHDINQSQINTTRFAVLSSSENRNISDGDGAGFMMFFTVKNEAGALAEAVNIIGKYGFNMVMLKSRAMKELLWQYYFYIEAEGNICTENGKKMLNELLNVCDKLKVVGAYSQKEKL